jgi:hypothetical protein
MAPWSNDTSATTPPPGDFKIPVTNPQDWFRGSANSTPPSAMRVPTTSVAAVQKQAQLQQKNSDNKLGMFGLRDAKR